MKLKINSFYGIEIYQREVHEVKLIRIITTETEHDTKYEYKFHVGGKRYWTLYYQDNKWYERPPRFSVEHDPEPSFEPEIPLKQIKGKEIPHKFIQTDHSINYTYFNTLESEYEAWRETKPGGRWPHYEAERKKYRELETEHRRLKG